MRVRRKKPRAEEGAGKAGREKQIWIEDRHGRRAFDSLEAAALYMSKDAGFPFEAWQVMSALKRGFSLCGMTCSYTKPEAGDGKRAPLLRRNALDGGIRRIH
jgi:hypothetical protein